MFVSLTETFYLCGMKIELLAPAKDAEIGIEAIRHGADAVYIGASQFGARSAAGNSVEDIERLASFGHQYGAKTIVALNTILRDEELASAERLSWDLYNAGADALIIQDLGLLRLNLPPIELHASTQTDNRAVEKVRLLSQLGMKRVVLARELSVAEIRAIHEAVPEVELECFVHGALCVCVSGQCYMSAALTGRSANRGECAQPCRLPMDLLDAQGRTLIRQKHLLSLRDMNRSEYLEQIIAAGVTSLKIEGRLKDVSYVKNVVAYYRRQLDGIFLKHPDWATASSGRSNYSFEPKLEKSFNRGFTDYFADGEPSVMWNFDSPKSMGEKIGVVASVASNSFTFRKDAKDAVSSAVEPLNNGDGLVADKTIGFRLNRYETETGRCFPLGGTEVCSQLKPGMELRRNLDAKFDQLLQKPSAKRKMEVDLTFRAGESAIALELRDESGVSAIVEMSGPFERAQKPQSENYQKQLTKLGETIFSARLFRLTGSDEWYVPGSVLNQLRRDAVEKLIETRQETLKNVRQSFQQPDYVQLIADADGRGILPEDYRANLLNEEAQKVYEILGVQKTEEAFEKQPQIGCSVMFTRHCLKRALGGCRKYPLKSAEVAPDCRLDERVWSEPLYLRIGKEKFLIKFGCNNLCISEIIRIFAPVKN